MKALLAVGDRRFDEHRERFLAGWHEAAPSDTFDIIYGDPSYETLRTWWPEDIGLVMRAGDYSAYEAGRTIAHSNATTIFVEGNSPVATPDGGVRFLQGLSGASTTTDYHQLLTDAYRVIGGRRLTIIVTSRDHMLGLDGALSREDGFEGMDEDQIYQQVRTVSQRMRDAYAFGQTSPSSVVAPQASGGEQAPVDGDIPCGGQVSGGTVPLGGQTPAGTVPLKGTLSLNGSLSLAGPSVNAGKCEGGALWGGGLEVLYRLGVGVQHISDAIDSVADYATLINDCDLIVGVEAGLHQWTIDDLFINRVIDANSAIGRPVLVVTKDSSMGLREAGDNGIDGIFVAQSSAEDLWFDTGLRCGRTWTR